jgi:hypothetical protein
MKVGDRSRCLRCGGKIIIIDHPGIISLDIGLWVHVGTLRRAFSTHPAVGPS